MLIPRQVFFSRPERAFPQISAEGNHIAYLAYEQNSVQICLLEKAEEWQGKPRVLVQFDHPAINFFWSMLDNLLLFMEHSVNEGNTCLFAVDIVSGEKYQLIKHLQGGLHLLEHSNSQRGEILIGSNHRDPHWYDIYRVDIEENTSALVYENDRFSGFLAEDRQLRLAVSNTPSGGNEYFIADDGSSWESLFEVGSEDAETTTPLCMNSAQDQLFITDSRGYNTSVLSVMNLKDGSIEVLAENECADVEETLLDKQAGCVEAVGFNYMRKQWQAITTDIAADFEFLQQSARGDLSVSSRSLDNNSWVVGYARDEQPNTYYLYQREDKTLTPLFSNISRFEQLNLQQMQHRVTASADKQFEIISYYTLPYTKQQSLPLVVLVHGGPWTRDKWGYNPWHQWLANRGYAVLSVNFRGSSGFGKAFMNAGDREWGGKMIEDIHISVMDFVRHMPIDKDRIGVMGTSYGGYAALMLASRFPGTYACAIDVFGPTNLVSMIESIPPQWQSQRDMLVKRVGNPDSDAGRQLLEEQSPIAHLDSMSAPLLIAEGFHDPRVDRNGIRAYAKQFSEKSDLPLIHISFPDEGHNLVKESNRLAFTAIAETFLQRYLSGDCESYEPSLLDEVEILSGSDSI